jgi:hypothetical protein
MPHDHKYIIADGQAVQVLLDKMLGWRNATETPGKAPESAG